MKTDSDSPGAPGAPEASSSEIEQIGGRKTGGGGLFGPASVVGGATAFSRVLGLVRVQLMAYFFGAGTSADAFFVAFRIPNLFRDLFAEGSLSTAFVPVFKKTMVTEGQKRAQTLSDRLFTLLLLIVSVVCVLGAIFASTLVYLAAEGFSEDPAKFALTVSLTRWMFPYLLFVSLAALLMGILNSYGKFGVPALASSMFNLGMIFSMLFLYDVFELPVYSLAAGALVGGLGQFAIQVPALYRAGHRLRFDFNFNDSGIKAIGRLMAPMIIGLSASRINILVTSLLASLQGSGAVSYLSYGYQLMHFPLGVFGLAIGTAALPRASEQVARGNMSEFSKTLTTSLRMIIFLIIPSTVYLCLFNENLIRLIYVRGAFGPEDAQAVSLALFWYTIGLPAMAGVRVVAPMFYALSDAKTPMRFSMYSMVVNIILSLGLIYTPGINMGFSGLAAAISLAGWLNLILLMRDLKRRSVFADFAPLWDSLGKTVLAASAMALAIFFQPVDLSFGLDGLPGKIFHVAAEIFIGAAVYFLACALLGLDEFTTLVSRLRRFRRRSKK